MLSNLFKKDLAGIYFSSKGIVLVQQSAGRIKNHLSLPYPSGREQAASIVSDDIFDVFKNNDIEMTAFLQKAIRDSKIDTSNIVVALPPKDLIIRFFEMPNIPRAEVLAGINFEMKKYIPFKLEELAYDFQFRIKQKANIIEVVLCGIKQDPLDKYVKLFKQLNLDPIAFEPGLFSLFRLLFIKSKIASQQSYCVLEFDQKEANILIVEKGFPYFTRDIKLVPQAGAVRSQDEFDAVLFRLINEVRVSLDYYKRQFLKKDIDEMLIISGKAFSGWVDHFSKELGLKVNFIALNELLKIKDIHDDVLSDSAKAFGAALRIERPSLVTLNLWKAKDKAEKASSLALTGVSGVNVGEMVLSFLQESRSAIIKGLIIGALIVSAGYLSGSSKVFPLEKELAAASIKQPPLLPGIDLSGLEGVLASERNFIEKDRDYRSFIQGYTFFYKKLFLLPRLLPKGVWIDKLTYSYMPPSLKLSCYSYSDDKRVTSENINNFIMKLKQSNELTDEFSVIDLKSYRETSAEGIYYMQFDVQFEKAATVSR
ncbi:MAG: pilus assembly protein PilM [Candidatus Omnitrophica bacterium]|nr:pilus assembly protein PilM [Candidatus Omnitrophota bacterium]